MKFIINIKQITWERWFVISTLVLVFDLLVLVNLEELTMEACVLILVITINWLLSVIIGIHKY